MSENELSKKRCLCQWVMRPAILPLGHGHFPGLAGCEPSGRAGRAGIWPGKGESLQIS